MAFKIKALIGLVLLVAAMAIACSTQSIGQYWVRFAVYLVAVLFSSGMKVPGRRGDLTMSVNFPFILLALIELSLPQALCIAAVSVFAQCNFRVQKIFTAVQIAFNVSNAVNATAAAWLTYVLLLRFGLAVAPAVALAAVVYFFVNTVTLALILGWSSAKPVLQVWKQDFLWYLPFYVIGATLVAVGDFLSIHLGWPTSLLMLPVVYTIYRAYRGQVIRIRDREQHLDDMEALHLRTIEALAMAIEAKDQNTHDHLLRVRVYVAKIGAVLKLGKLEMQALLTAALLHDIGKLAVPEHIINKPGKLTHEEFEKMKIHPSVGADILERVRFPYPVVPIVRSHHEWWNGMGYPDGLVGEAIPLGARILTVVDCFDALASDRPYRLAMPMDEALAMVKKSSGTQFDPRVVAILEENCKELEDLARREGEKLMRLNTEFAVERGLAPGAGFEEDSSDIKARVPPSTEIKPAVRVDLVTNYEALNLIAAASQEAQALFEMNQSLGNSLSLNETISVMGSRLHELIAFDCSVVYLKSEDAVIPQHLHGESARYFSNTKIQLGHGISGWVAENGKSILNGNALVEPNLLRASVAAVELQSALSVPLLDLRGDVFGVLTLYSRQPSAFSREDLRILQAIQTKFSLALANAMRFHRVQSDATTDFLTNLPNARHLFLQLDALLVKASSVHGSLAVVVCDLNSFKSFNDKWGHLTGNLLLAAVAEGFRSCCRPEDTVARLGGDEFVFLIPGINQENATCRLEKIAQVVANANLGIADATPISASLGAAFYPADAETVEELLALADRRMYLQKRDHYQAEEARTLLPTLVPDPVSRAV